MHQASNMMHFKGWFCSRGVWMGCYHHLLIHIHSSINAVQNVQQPWGGCEGLTAPRGESAERIVLFYSDDLILRRILQRSLRQWFRWSVSHNRFKCHLKKKFHDFRIFMTTEWCTIRVFADAQTVTVFNCKAWTISFSPEDNQMLYSSCWTLVFFFICFYLRQAPAVCVLRDPSQCSVLLTGLSSPRLEQHSLISV